MSCRYLCRTFPGKEAVLSLMKRWPSQASVTYHSKGWMFFQFPTLQGLRATLEKGPYLTPSSASPSTSSQLMTTSHSQRSWPRTSLFGSVFQTSHLSFGQKMPSRRLPQPWVSLYRLMKLQSRKRSLMARESRYRLTVTSRISEP